MLLIQATCGAMEGLQLSMTLHQLEQHKDAGCQHVINHVCRHQMRPAQTSCVVWEFIGCSAVKLQQACYRCSVDS